MSFCRGIQTAKERNMKFFSAYLKQHMAGIAVFLLSAVVFMCVFSLYALPLQAVLYPLAVCCVAALLILFFDYRRALKKHRLLQNMLGEPCELLGDFPEQLTADDADYQALIVLILDEKRHRDTQMNIKYDEMIEYYTVWAHQIKTPIASIRLTLENEDSALSGAVLDDLLRIEQYVEMVLMFLRLDSDSSDYLIRAYNLDRIVKSAVKKMSRQFINRKISLDYRVDEISVLTDEKWLSFVVEQVISNALKYTPAGTVSIYTKGARLCIRDSGIGIAPQDLPRIFEKGYTGCNGRSDKRASGIGLYLCKRICDNLGHSLSAESALDEGTMICIDLEARPLEVE